MRVAWLVLVAAGCAKNLPALTVTTSFPVTVFTGANPSPLDPLMSQRIDIEIEWEQVAHNRGDGNDPPGCLTTALLGTSVRIARGATEAVVQSQILDPLPDWDVRLQLCDAGGRSSIVTEAVIDRLNLSFGCFGLPAFAKGNDGYPEVTSFTASMCMATILDVDNNRVVGNDDFEMTYTTGPDQLP